MHSRVRGVVSGLRVWGAVEKWVKAWGLEFRRLSGFEGVVV